MTVCTVAGQAAGMNSPECLEWAIPEENAWVGCTASRLGSKICASPTGGPVFMLKAEEENGACKLFFFPEKSTNIVQNQDKETFLLFDSGIVQIAASMLPLLGLFYKGRDPAIIHSPGKPGAQSAEF